MVLFHVDLVMHLWLVAIAQAMIREPWKNRVKFAEILLQHVKDGGVAGKQMVWHQTRTTRRLLKIIMLNKIKKSPVMSCSESGDEV